jgi:hypothetical protein
VLTDIFSHRYADILLFEAFAEKDSRFITQAFKIVSEDIFPYYVNGDTNENNKKIWEILQSKLSRELGLKSLSAATYAYNGTLNGKQHLFSGINPVITVCENFILAKFDSSITPDVFIKDRISFIELAFRQYEDGLKAHTKYLEMLKPDTPLGKLSEALSVTERNLEQQNQRLKKLKSYVEELNTRLKQAGYKLHYHNGFIQISSDELIESQIQEPFWSIISDENWKNVDIDMKEAIDIRDSNGRDPAFYAAKALESTIKIISDRKGWTQGSERGAKNYIDNLASKKNGDWLNTWEKEALQNFFLHVRNPFSHGAGNNEMPALSKQQTDWAIGFCMIWIKNLIERI